MANAGRRVSREDAFLIVRGWMEDDAPIIARASLPTFAFSMRGRITEATALDIRVVGSGPSEFVMKLDPAFDSWYVDPRDFPEEAETAVCSLMFFFPEPDADGEPNFLSLEELKKSS